MWDSLRTIYALAVIGFVAICAAAVAGLICGGIWCFHHLQLVH